MKRHELFFGMIKVPIEFIVVYLSFFMARDIRKVTDLIPGIQIPYKSIPEFNFTIFSLLGSVLFIFVFFYLGLYNMQIKSSRIKQVVKIIEGGFFWFLLYIGFLYLSLGFLYDIELPRLIIFFTLFISIFLVFIERTIIDLFQKNLLERGLLQKTKIAIITDTLNNEIIDSINVSGIYEIVGYYNSKKTPNIGIKYLGNNTSFATNAKTNLIEEILFVSSDFDNEAIDEIFEYSRIFGISYKYIANTFDFTKNNTETSFINKIPVVEIRSIGLTPWGRIVKRVFDIIFSGIGLILLIPIFLVVGFLEIIESGGFNIFYGSYRVGKGGRLFKMYKFRSMKINAEQEKDELLKRNERKDGPLFKIENDPRITPLGTFLRKYDIDELPQLWNVFIGNMSIIGPRPHLPEEVAIYKDYQKRVLTLKPGITGMAQTHGRHKNSFDDEVRLDIFYIENWNFLLDLKILFKTARVVLGREGR